jgi:hypothetical protein
MMRSPNRLVALVFGAGYLVLGAGGFFVAEDGLLFGVFSVNPVQNATHLAIGAALLVAGLAGLRPAAIVNAVTGAVCLLLGLAGLFVVGTEFNLLALSGAGNVLHFGSAVLLLAVGAGAERATRNA